MKASSPNNPESGHWIVRVNYRNRTILYALLFLTFGVHILSQGLGLAVWTLLGLQFLVYPHICYAYTTRAAHPIQSEQHNMMLDGLIFGCWSGALGFPLSITMILVLGTVYNLLVFMGPGGLMTAVATLSLGGLAAFGLFDPPFMPPTTLATDVACFSSTFVYMCLVACGTYYHALRLRDARQQLRKSQQALQEVNQTLVLQIHEVNGLQAQLSDQANRDPLTGLFNRRYLDSTISRELARCQRDNLAASLILIDIDNFKTINDTYGHQAGDEVLKTLATMLKSRASDIASRFGGEEFLMLLPSMPLPIAIERAERLRQLFASHPIHYGSASIQATLSIGVASYPSHAQSPSELIRCADKALYRAKAGGKNCVNAFDNPELLSA